MDSTATTREVRVDVRSFFVPERSDVARGVWFFAYEVTIENVGDRPVQLVSRHWRITDANDRVQHVRGPGVIGETPLLAPGDRFTYQSFCPLPTPFGTMDGAFQMIYPHAEDPGFDAIVAPFALASPDALH